MKLIIGNKRYSSWSLRPWLLMKQFEISFEEHLIALDQPATEKEIAQISPSGRVPVLVDGALTIWDSLAIAEYLNDKYPAKNLWPAELSQRAWARAISCEMHSGFADMREVLSHDIQKNLKEFGKNFEVVKVQKDINRVKHIWQECLNASGGPFLFGTFSIADAMYAPVVNRFVSYAVPIEDVKNYVQTMRDLPAHKMWIEAAMNEKLRLPRYEDAPQ